MWRLFLADICITVAIILLWYCWFRVWLLHRTREVLKWIHAALERHGKVTGIEALSGSRFRINLRLDSSLFHTPHLVVELAPREWPLNWLWHLVTRRHETVTFYADLENRPAANLEVANHRWCGHRRQSRMPKSAPTYVSQNVGALVITTREHWEFNSMVDALLLSRSCNFLRVSFRRKSPHLTATIALDTLRPGAPSSSNMFDVLRELAAGASTSA